MTMNRLEFKNDWCYSRAKKKKNTAATHSYFNWRNICLAGVTGFLMIHQWLSSFFQSCSPLKFPAKVQDLMELNPTSKTLLSLLLPLGTGHKTPTALCGPHIEIHCPDIKKLSLLIVEISILHHSSSHWENFLPTLLPAMIHVRLQKDTCHIKWPFVCSAQSYRTKATLYQKFTFLFKKKLSWTSNP